MTGLDAVRAATLAQDASESGASAAVLTVVGDPAGELEARRVLLIRRADGSTELQGELGVPGSKELLGDILDDPRAADGLREVDVAGRVLEAYVEIRRPVRDLVVVGAGHIARPLTAMGATLGFRVTVLDDRPDFATRERFPEAEHVIRTDFSDPFKDVDIHGGSHVLLVTRGHKYDYECLLRVLRMDPAPAYIGMIGSRRRVRATYEKLVEEGIPRARLAEIHAPVGLDIGAETPEEIAVAVAAELVLDHRGGSGAPLRQVERVAERFFDEEEEA